MTELTPVFLQQSLNEMLQSAGVFVSVDSSNNACSFVVGLSGGVDSVVLLHALSFVKSSNENMQLKAIHINHQLQAQADEWQLFCVSLCKNLNIPLTCIHVDARPKNGEGPEAAARLARYDAFRNEMEVDDVLLTAHHLDDQVETVFLQMLRGTGVAGAAGIMPVSRFNNSYLVRPLLAFDRKTIESYAVNNNLHWVDDPSNTETHYDRNYLRHQVLPVVEKRWPAYRDTLGRFAQNMRQASELLLQIAEQDLHSVILTNEKNVISIEKLKKLSLPRQTNILRYWINSLGFVMPSLGVMKQIRASIVAKEDAIPCVTWGQAELRRFKQELYLLQKNFRKTNKLEKNYSLAITCWEINKKIEIPGIGFLTLVLSKNDGIKKEYFESNQIEIKFRKGGERCKPVGRHKAQTLKKLFQEYHIPPWQRDAIPIVYINGEIAAVVNVFYCIPFASNPSQQLHDEKQKNMINEDSLLAITFTKL